MGVGRNDPCPCGSGKKYKQCCERSKLPQATTASPGIPLLLRQASAHMEARQWPQAEARCREILAVSPQHADALYLWGTMALQLGNHATAADLLGKAVAAAPAPGALMHLHRGIALRKLGRPDEAALSLRQALQLQPRNATAHFQLAMLLQLQGQLDAAVASYGKAVALQPDNADAWSNLGLLHLQAQRHGDAETCFRKALQAQPASAQIVGNLSALLQLTGKLDAAVTLLRQALVRQPGSIPLLSNLASALMARDEPAAAEALLRQAIALAPGAALHRRDLALALMLQGQMEASVEQLHQVLASQPADNVAFSHLLFALLYTPDTTPEQLLNAHRAYGVRFEAPFQSQTPQHGNDRQPQRRLKIGYVSSDFRSHAVAWLFEPVLAHHDQTQVEIFCYYNNAVEDAVTARLRAAAGHWRPCATLSDAELATAIRADGIDILVDLNGHTAGNRLLTFVRRPAPVQVTWLGYPGSTGLQTGMDYRLTDRFFDPEDVAARGYSEKVIYLPRWAVFRPMTDSPPVNDLPALGNGSLTLACLNSLTKLGPAVIALWAQLLHGLPGARLLIGNVSTEEARTRLLARFAAEGVPPERLELLPKLPLSAYLALHQRIDLALDPFPFTGGVTTYHSLWMGVPVVTLSGTTAVSRQGAAIMQGVGLPEFVTYTPQQYLGKIIELGTDLPRLQAIRQSLRERMAASMNGQQQARDLEQAYAGMWQTWCAS